MWSSLTVVFLYGAGAETLLLVTNALGKICPRAEKPTQWCIPRKPRKTMVLVSGAEIQTSVVDSRTAVWVSTAEKIVLRETQKFSRKFGVVSRQLSEIRKMVVSKGCVCGCSLDIQNRKEGTKNGTTIPESGTSVHSPRPPFYKTAFCFLSKF